MHTCKGGGGAFAHIKIGRGAAGYDTCVRGYVRRGGGISRPWTEMVRSGGRRDHRRGTARRGYVRRTPVSPNLSNCRLKPRLYRFNAWVQNI
jgi:hypothetical protein